MKPIAVFYHCLFVYGEPPGFSDIAFQVIQEQMNLAHQSGLIEVAQEVIVGVNGGDESDGFAGLCFPERFKVVQHGLDCRCENPTIREIEKWLPGHPDWHVLYFHAKGATHPAGDNSRVGWRNCMMRHLVWNWRQCVKDLEHGYDSVGCHWLVPPSTPPGQYIWGGNFWWANSNYLLTLPSILERDRIKTSGLTSLESRYEAEVWIGNGPRLPKIRDYHHEHPASNLCR